MQREVNRLLKLINAEKLKSNHKQCIEMYNIIGGLYTEVGSYDEALHYHGKALDHCKTIGDRLATAVALRYIGEAKAAQGHFYQAVEHIKRYLELAQRCEDKVEIQRACTTLGRVYLMQAQEMKEKGTVGERSVREVALEADKRLQEALNLAESVRDQVDEREFAQMRSGIFMNLGLVKEIQGKREESVIKLYKAVELCRKAKLKEELFRCQMVLTGMFRNHKNIKQAVKVSDEALATARSLGKKLLICDALIERGLTRLHQRDFREAKRMFARAYLEKSPNEEDHIKAIRLTKLSHLIIENYERLSLDAGELGGSSETRMRLCDKLGDLFVAVGCFKLAVEFYKRAYAEAKVCGRPRSELAKILYSIAETYSDDGQFGHAIVVYNKELDYRAGNPSEECQTLAKIAHMNEYMKNDARTVVECYERALAKAGREPKLQYRVLRDYLEFVKDVRRHRDVPGANQAIERGRLRELESLFESLSSLAGVAGEQGPEEENNEDDEHEQLAAELDDEVANVDDIITDDEENDELLTAGKRKSGRAGAKRFKANEVGDSPLHEACIQGDLKRVQCLLDSGHELNPVDNAGWTPLHEAANHGHLQIVRLLVERGANVNQRALNGLTPLHDCATNGHYDIMRLLIASGANVIALTDAGHTVLSFLRDFKERNYSQLSNQEMAACRLMEAELVELMDKCGYNLLEEKGKAAPAASGAAGPQAGPSGQRAARPRNSAPGEPPGAHGGAEPGAASAPGPAQDPVRDYRHTMGQLKRKRLPGQLERDQVEAELEQRKSSLPAVYSTGSANPSAATKDWLVDDVSRKSRRPSMRRQVDWAEEEEEEEEVDDEVDDEVEEVAPEVAPRAPAQGQGPEGRRPRTVLHSSDSDSEVREVGVVAPRPAKAPLLIELTGSEPSQAASAALPGSQPGSLSGRRSASPCGATSGGERRAQDEPVEVELEGARMLVPVRDEYATVAAFKEALGARFGALGGAGARAARARLELAPASRPGALLFDADLCAEVLRERRYVGRLLGWLLEPAEAVYRAECERLQLQPLGAVSGELARLAAMGNKLELRHVRLPRAHLAALAAALARRPFVEASLGGSAALLACSAAGPSPLLETIATWRQLERLELAGCGLADRQLARLLAPGQAGPALWPRLLELDLAHNQLRAAPPLERLRQAAPALRRLQLQANDLAPAPTGGARWPAELLGGQRQRQYFAYST